MRLVTYSFRGTRRLGALSGARDVVDLNRALAARLASEGVAPAAASADRLLPPAMLDLLAGGDAALAEARRALEHAVGLAGADRARAEAEGIVFRSDEPGFRLEAPVPRPGKVLAVGVNYRDHAAEAKFELPKHPLIFSKVSTCITGPGMPVHRPRVSTALDWEGELCFVIGKPARHVPAERALEFVAGYTVGHDVSVRDWQFHSQTMMMGKGFDTHGPIGPALVTRDEVPDPGALDLKTWVNGELMQSANTGQMIFGVPALVEYLTKAFTLEPGDVVFTGTPAGVGGARKPPIFLKAGDVVRIEIERLGVLENPIVEEP